MSTERRILEGVRVLDITQVIAGPLCGRMLADLGADVIKVDRPPPANADGAVRSNGAVAVNLGKRSIAIDLQRPEGAEVALALARRADVLLENFRPGVMVALGLGYGQLSDEHPRIVYASISGFGQTGPAAQRRAFGSTAHAEAGLLWLQQRALGGDAPFAPGLTVADIVTGMNAFSGVLAALYDREHTGRGQHVDVSLVESQLAMLHEAAEPALNGEVPDGWHPFRHPIYAAKDGHVCINAFSPRIWSVVAAGLGHRDAPPPASREEVEATLGPWIAGMTVEQVERGLSEAGAPFGIVRSMPEAVRDPHFVERGMIAEVPDPLEGSVRAISSPLHLSQAATGPAAGAPLAGQHTRQVLADELGYEAAAIEALIESGAVAEQAVPERVPG